MTKEKARSGATKRAKIEGDSALFPSKKHHRPVIEDIAGIRIYERPGRNGKGVDQVDFSKARVLHAGFDTVESLYRGDLDDGKAGQLLSWYERQKSEGVFDPTVMYQGWLWIMRPAAKSSGFRWQLVNNELGINLFFGSIYVKGGTGKECTTVKLRAAPHYLIENDHADCVALYDRLAGGLIEDGQARRYACAVHLCVDVMGIQMPDDFTERLSLRSKLLRDHQGQASLAWQGANVVQRFGGIQSVLAGSRKALQFAAYNKTQAAFEQDKVNLWRGVWEANQSLRHEGYNGERVWRFEYRLHHDVLIQMEKGTGINLRDQAEVAQQARNIWLKCLDTIRLDQSRDYVDPLWQFLAEAVESFGNPPYVEIKRHYAYSAGASYERKLIFAVAYCLSIWVAQGLDYDQIFWKLTHAGLWGGFDLYCRERELDPHKELRRRVNLKRLSGEGLARATGFVCETDRAPAPV